VSFSISPRTPQIRSQVWGHARPEGRCPGCRGTAGATTSCDPPVGRYRLRRRSGRSLSRLARLAFLPPLREDRTGPIQGSREIRGGFSGQTLDRHDSECCPALADFCGRLIFRRCIPALGRFGAGKLDDRHTAGYWSRAFEQRVVLTARQIAAAELLDDGLRDFAVAFLDVFRAGGVRRSTIT
jgi:hypothetical protein